MTYVITGDCCSDASCLSVCPVDCIHPSPGGSGFEHVETLSVDPLACIDCGACSDACPVGAAVPADRLTGPDRVWIELNARATSVTPMPLAVSAATQTGTSPPVAFAHFDAAQRAAAAYRGRSLKVAVVGTGPSAAYTTRALLNADTEVTVIDRDHAPGGLLRGGVAPDHLGTREINERFATTWRNPRVRVWPGIEVGRDLTAAELLEHHDAVVLAVGAGHSRRLGVEGEELAGSYTAEQVVGWYNVATVNHDATPLELSSERAVIVGTGNVALDVARIVLSEPESLTSTAISPRALAAIHQRQLREVVLLARRGPADLACSYSELHALIHNPGFDVVVVGDGPIPASAATGSVAGLLADVPRIPFPTKAPPAGVRRVVFCFDSSVETITGDDAVTGLLVRGRAEPLPCGLVVTAIGYESRPPEGIESDPATGVIANADGRVLNLERVVPGIYVTGWAKRGPSGGIGANRADAEQTVAHLLLDASRGRLVEPRHGRLHLTALLTARQLRDRVSR